MLQKISVLYADESLLVINKPAHLAVHATPTKKATDLTLVDWLIKNYPEIRGVGEDPIRPGIVHRLDKETSGVMLIARTQPAFELLKKSFATRQVEKKYTALVHGLPTWEAQESTLAIRRGEKGTFVARHPNDVATLPQGEQAEYRESVTHFSVQKRFSKSAMTLLEARPKTGRTHQIRVHLKALGFPIVGDALYSPKKALEGVLAEGLNRQFLHAAEIRFLHPITGEQMTFTAPLPDELTQFLNTLT